MCRSRTITLCRDDGSSSWGRGSRQVEGEDMYWGEEGLAIGTVLVRLNLLEHIKKIYIYKYLTLFIVVSNIRHEDFDHIVRGCVCNP